MTWSTGPTDVWVKVAETWLRMSAVQAVTTSIIRTDARVHLAGGGAIVLRDVTPDDVVTALAEAVKRP